MPIRPAAALVALLLAPVAAPGVLPADGGTGFAGTWVLDEAKDDVVGKTVQSSPSASLDGGGFDLPLEVMTDARRLVVADDGTTVRVTYPSGRIRTFVADGRTRYVDDGDGPADVTVRRKGETVTVSSEWRRGYRLRETWEVRSAPRRLVVTGKLKGRESNEYVRSYAPGAPGDASPAGAKETGVAPSPAAPGAVATPQASAAAAWIPPAVDRLGECSIHPPRNAAQEELNRLARVRQEEAGRTAVASLAPLKPADVISSDVEDYEGCLVWSFTLRVPERKGVQEVFVDAGDGKVVRSEFVPTGPPASAPPSP